MQSSSNSTNWPKLAESTYKALKKNAKNMKKLDGQPNDKLAATLKSPIYKDYISKSNYPKSQTVRALIHMFGVDMDKTSGIGSVCMKSEKDTNRLLSQVEPIIPYVSKKFLRRLSKSLNNAKSGSKKSEIDMIAEISSKGKLTDYLMKIVNDGQLSFHADRNSEVDEFITPKSCKRSLVRSKTKVTKDDDVTECDDDIKMVSALKVENQKLRKQIERFNVSGGNDHLLIERIEAAISEVGDDLRFTKKPWNGGSTFKRNEHGTAVLHISDWHIGSKENVNGFNSFDYSVACERVKTLANKYIDWTKMHRSLYSIDELVIIATGDMISGDIHDELIRTNEFSVPEQCVRASTLISKLANELSGCFKKVRVEYIVADNHSRTTAKIEFGDGTNSYNYLVGYMSKLMLSANKSVEFNLYPEIQKVIKVENLKYLITHGNCVRGGFAGIPFYSMQRKVGAEASIRMNMSQDFHFDKIVMGHYHVPMRSTQYEMTGCLSSTTMFDHSAGRHCRACQTAWIVSKDNELDYFEIWLS